ncbi:MAG: signal peptidase II [Deltaproteobacteria bacterium]|nr:signal peptidase II [Deltaproteobacteria bacterium]
MARKFAVLLPILLVGVVLDQLTKLAVVRLLPLGAQVPVFQGFFNLVHIRNRGVAFGLLANLGVSYAWLFFVFTTLLVLIVVGWLWWRLPPGLPTANLAYSLIITGAMGNFIDRVRLGEVIDFLDFYVSRYHWPAFNVADSLVCLGAALLVYVILTEKEGDDVSHPV